MNTITKTLVAIVVLLAASFGVLSGSGQANAATVAHIPGTLVAQQSPVRWDDSQASYPIDGGYKVVTRFYGLKHCYFNTARTTHDAAFCFTVSSNHTVVVRTYNGKFAVTSVKN